MHMHYWLVRAAVPILCVSANCARRSKPKEVTAYSTLKGFRLNSSKSGPAEPKLTASARNVFLCLAREGEATRPDLARRLGLSRPTLSAAMSDLARAGYVEAMGLRDGSTGRKPAMYRIGAGAGHVIVVDAGSTFVRLRVSTLDGHTLYGGGYQLATEQRRFSAELTSVVVQAVRAAMAEAREDWGNLRAIGIALPTKVSCELDQPEEIALHKHLVDEAGIAAELPLILENNVNCAALAEGVKGVASGVDDFAYIQVGVKIGMGIVLGGELVRGRNGGAGEVSYLPFPWLPDAEPRQEELENYLGSESLLRRVRGDWPDGETPPTDAIDLFRLAGQGHAAAIERVEHYARDIGRLVAACVAVLDPGLVVLGGGIGQNSLILPQVRQVADELSVPTRVEVTGLGDEATLMGIQHVALRRAQERLVGESAG